MTPEELCDILDLAVAHHHDVAESHGAESCNCFRVAFGEALIAKYGFSEEAMIAEQERRLHHVRAFNITMEQAT